MNVRVMALAVMGAAIAACSGGDDAAGSTLEGSYSNEYFGLLASPHGTSLYLPCRFAAQLSAIPLRPDGSFSFQLTRTFHGTNWDTLLVGTLTVTGNGHLIGDSVDLYLNMGNTLTVHTGARSSTVPLITNPSCAG